MQILHFFGDKNAVTRHFFGDWPLIFPFHHTYTKRNDRQYIWVDEMADNLCRCNTGEPGCDEQLGSIRND